MSSFLCSEERGELPASCCSTARPPSAPNRLNPYAEHMYDGIDLSPFEIMFVKLKEFLLEANWTTATQGKKYSLWSLHQVCARVRGLWGRVRLCAGAGAGAGMAGALVGTWMLPFLGAGRGQAAWAGKGRVGAGRRFRTKAQGGGPGKARPRSWPQSRGRGPTLQPAHILFVGRASRCAPLPPPLPTPPPLPILPPRPQGDIRDNEYTARSAHLRLIKILGMRHRGPACFDYGLYRQRNPDLPKWGEKELWEHFVMHGQHEGRVFRCGAGGRAGRGGRAGAGWQVGGCGSGGPLPAGPWAGLLDFSCKMELGQVARCEDVKSSGFLSPRASFTVQVPVSRAEPGTRRGAAAARRRRAGSSSGCGRGHGRGACSRGGRGWHTRGRFSAWKRHGGGCRGAAGSGRGARSGALDGQGRGGVSCSAGDERGRSAVGFSAAARCEPQRRGRAQPPSDRLQRGGALWRPETSAAQRVRVRRCRAGGALLVGPQSVGLLPVGPAAMLTGARRCFFLLWVLVLLFSSYICLVSLNIGVFNRALKGAGQFCSFLTSSLWALLLPVKADPS